MWRPKHTIYKAFLCEHCNFILSSWILHHPLDQKKKQQQQLKKHSKTPAQPVPAHEPDIVFFFFVNVTRYSKRYLRSASTCVWFLEINQ